MPVLPETSVPVVEAPVSSLRRGQRDPLWLRYTLTGLALTLLTVLVIVPVLFVFVQALDLRIDLSALEFHIDFAPFVELFTEDDETLASIATTLIVAPVSVALNTVF